MGGGTTAGHPVLRPYHYSKGRLFQLFGGKEDSQEKCREPLKSARAELFSVAMAGGCRYNKNRIYIF